VTFFDYTIALNDIEGKINYLLPTLVLILRKLVETDWIGEVNQWNNFELRQID